MLHKGGTTRRKHDPNTDSVEPGAVQLVALRHTGLRSLRSVLPPSLSKNGKRHTANVHANDHVRKCSSTTIEDLHFVSPPSSSALLSAKVVLSWMLRMPPHDSMAPAVTKNETPHARHSKVSRFQVVSMLHMNVWRVLKCGSPELLTPRFSRPCAVFHPPTTVMEKRELVDLDYWYNNISNTKTRPATSLVISVPVRFGGNTFFPTTLDNSDSTQPSAIQHVVL